jgi:uncharacterized protein YoxC
MKNYISIIICWIITIYLAVYTNDTINDFNSVIKNVELTTKGYVACICRGIDEALTVIDGYLKI